MTEEGSLLSPKFTITNKILVNIGQIEASKEVIENAPLVPAFEAEFRKEALVRSAHYGTHIEGNPLNLQEAREVLDGREIHARDRDIQEVINYRNVINYIDQYQKNDTEESPAQITEDVLLKIHKLVVDKVLPSDKSGFYREGQAVVKNFKTDQITFVAPTAQEVPGQVHNFLEWLATGKAKDVHPVLKAGIIHYELARIHPFSDGNGRTARAVATLSLFLDGYDIKRFFSLEEYFDKTAPDYYMTLQLVSNQPVATESMRDLTPWLEYFTEGLSAEFVRIKERVKHMSIDIKLKGKMGQLQLSYRQSKLIEYMQDYSTINNQQWRTLFPDVSDDTILRDLHDLIKKKLVKKKGKTKAAVYYLSPNA